ncbi:polynucleotide adenylyltransferase PcnB [Methylococcus capsulatus]|uniref:polynucleotide adenylyltransferase PcnB n=1 Tax=Methylococcus capsulatus TaxID=414 RepID=UPI002FDB91AE
MISVQLPITKQPTNPLEIFAFIKRLIGALRPAAAAAPDPVSAGPRIYSRSEHSISRALISDNALKVLYRLRKAGYQAYLVGGCVRDLLLGREPKDFDVVTDAHPEEIKAVFRNCRLIGRRFRLAHVHFGEEIIEVATFRALTREPHDEHVTEGGRILRDNVYGTIEEDAFRRDFTVNALYYNISDFSVIDYVGGMDDHRNASLRLIGDPEQRYREDPVRMLRAIRFAVKLGFTLHPSCAEPIHRLADLLRDIPAARLYDEIVKLFLAGYAVQTFEQLRHFRLFGSLFPETENCLARENGGFPLIFLAKALERTDQRVQEDKAVAPYFLFSALLWEPVRSRAEARIAEGENLIVAYQEAASKVISRQIRHTAFPKTIGLPMREIWLLQSRFDKTQGGRPFRLLSHPRFRAAYDFLVLRAETGEAEPELAEWWTRFQSADEAEQKAMTRTGRRSGGKSRPRKRRGRPPVAAA